MSKISALTLLSSVFLLTSCTTGMGDFKILSTVNMNGLKYTSVDKKGRTQEVKGKACVHHMPLGIGTLGRKDARIRLAFDRAIKTADKSGTSDEYMLVNASVNNKSFAIPILYTYDCTVVVGDLAKIIRKNGETLEKLEAIPEKTKKEIAKDVASKLVKKGTNNEIGQATDGVVESSDGVFGNEVDGGSTDTIPSSESSS